MQEFTTLTYHAEDLIGYITMNRPKSGNALEVTISFDDLAEAIVLAANDDAAKVIILRGAGGHFCSGGDIKSFQKRIQQGQRIEEYEVRNVAKMIQNFRTCPKPIIGMISGACVGAGLSMAMACDLRIMGEKSYMAMAFIRMALCGDTGGFYNLVNACGMAKTLEYAMLGDTISAQEAYQFGLANKIVPDDQLEAETLKLAKRLSRGPLKAYEYQKKLMWDWKCRDYPIYAENEAVDMSACSYLDDFAEAVDAFVSKRKPNFTGR